MYSADVTTLSPNRVLQLFETYRERRTEQLLVLVEQ